VSFGNVKTVKPVELRIKHPEGERYVYHALLIDLQPNSVVHFVVRNGEETVSPYQKTFLQIYSLLIRIFLAIARAKVQNIPCSISKYLH